MAGSKLYEVTDIDFWDLTIEARKTDLNVSDVLESDICDITDFKDFHVTLHNVQGNLVDFEEWVKGMKIKSPNHIRV